MTDAIEDFVIACLEEQNPLPGADRADKLAYNFLDQGHIDSFGIMQLILSVEEHFEIRLSQEDLQSDEIRTVGGLVAIVGRHARQRQ